MYILMADDDKAFVEMMSEQLRLSGHEVTAVSEGGEAVVEAESRVPDLILLDIAMPGMYGSSAQKAFRDRPDTKDVPIIFMTGIDPARARQLLVDDGKTRLLTKPIRFEQLRETIEELTSE